MALEWLRRSDPKFAAASQDLPVHRRPDHRDRAAEIHGAGDGAGSEPSAPAADGSLGIGSLRTRGRTRNEPSVSRHARRSPRPAGRRSRRKRARTLRALLAARRVVDFKGPLGWGASDVELGRADPIASPPNAKDVQARLRRIQPLVELRIPFDMSRAELDAIDRGARDPDLDAVTAAAREIAIAEDRSIFHGYEAAHITGICQARAGVGVPLGASHADYPLAVATALTKLRDEGVEGPVLRGAERPALQGPRRRAPTAAIRSSATSSG